MPLGQHARLAQIPETLAVDMWDIQANHIQDSVSVIQLIFLSTSSFESF